MIVTVSLEVTGIQHDGDDIMLALELGRHAFPLWGQPGQHLYPQPVQTLTSRNTCQ